MRRVAKWEPDAEALAAYTGRYYSPELETFYTVSLEDEKLILGHRRHGDFVLTPKEKDVFASGEWWIGKVTFGREQDGHVGSMSLSNGRVRNLRFERVAPGREVACRPGPDPSATACISPADRRHSRLPHHTGHRPTKETLNEENLYLDETAFALSLLSLAVVSTVRAEDQPVVYTRVAQWQIARPNWGAYEKDLKKNLMPVMEKLLADGTITEFGADRTTVHSPDGYTHSTWFCARSLSGLEKALDALVESESKLLPKSVGSRTRTSREPSTPTSSCAPSPTTTAR